MYFYTFTAVYLFAAHRFTVCAADDQEARRRARGVASKAFALVLVSVEGL